MRLPIFTILSKNLTNILIQKEGFCSQMQLVGHDIAAGLRRAQPLGPWVSLQPESGPFRWCSLVPVLCQRGWWAWTAKPTLSQPSKHCHLFFWGWKQCCCQLWVDLQPFPRLLCYFSSEWARSSLPLLERTNGYKATQHTFTFLVWNLVLCPTR